MTAQAVWPAIIDQVTHERLRAVLTDPARQKYNGVEARRYLLTGFLFCGLCGKTLVARPRMDGRRTYVCASGPNFGGCGKIRRLADPVEDLVREQLLLALDEPALAAALKAATGEDEAERELLAALRADQDRLDELVDAFADGTLTRADLARARSRIETRMEATTRRWPGGPPRRRWPASRAARPRSGSSGTLTTDPPASRGGGRCWPRSSTGWYSSRAVVASTGSTRPESRSSGACSALLVAAVPRSAATRARAAGSVIR